MGGERGVGPGGKALPIRAVSVSDNCIYRPRSTEFGALWQKNVGTLSEVTRRDGLRASTTEDRRVRFDGTI